MRYHFAIIFIACLALCTASRAEDTPLPNIVLILADDMGYGDIRALNPEGKIPTPCLDTLAAQGMRFTDMHSPSSVCTPTRYSILTGRYNWRSRLKSGVLYGYDPPLIERERPTLASLLKDCGYHTAAIGKWHLGLGWQLTDARHTPAKNKPPKEEHVDFSKPFTGGPTALGFDYFYGIAASLDMPPYVFLENDRAVSVPATRKKWVREGAAATDFEAVDVLPALTAKAVAYLESRAAEAKAGKPFFLYLPLNSPHTPILPTDQWAGKSCLNAYADFVMQTDATVGTITETLEKLGLTENTIFIFTSDNGCSPQADFAELRAKGHDPSAGFRGMKADIFEGGHRVPFLVRWPGKVRAGSESDQLACLVDFMATFAEIAGVRHTGEDSVSLLDALTETARGPLRSEVIHHSINGSFAIRQGDWKLCLCPGSGGWSDPKPGSDVTKTLPPIQLYDMKTDSAETQNRERDEPERVREMKARMEELR